MLIKRNNIVNNQIKYFGKLIWQLARMVFYFIYILITKSHLQKYIKSTFFFIIGNILQTLLLTEILSSALFHYNLIILFTQTEDSCITDIK